MKVRKCTQCSQKVNKERLRSLLFIDKNSLFSLPGFCEEISCDDPKTGFGG